jgi:hypothetical protein
MRQFSPKDFRVGRYAALLEWLERFLSGIFPYGGLTRPSGFPFLFLFALPFYLLGDLGLLQIFSFLLFAYLLFLRKGNLSTIIFLLLSPGFYFEVLVRSELFTNMVLILSYLILWQKRAEQIKKSFLIPYGLLGGLLLATRGIALFPYLIFFPGDFRREGEKGIIFSLSLAFGFLLVNLPFFLWNPKEFIRSGPFSIQAAYIPFWLLLLSFPLGLIYGLKGRKEDSFPALSLFTFFLVFLPFLLTVFNYGFVATLFNTKFDISYFLLSLPFLLYSID